MQLPDATAMHNLEQLYEDCNAKHVTMVFSHVNYQPMKVMRKAKFDQKVGQENFCPHIDEALQRAEEIAKKSSK